MSLIPSERHLPIRLMSRQARLHLWSNLANPMSLLITTDRLYGVLKDEGFVSNSDIYWIA